MNETIRPTVPRWLHGWAVLIVIVALPLIALGAEVTTKQVGMADQQAVREPWYLATLPKDQLWAQGIGLVIEHSHRTAGWLVGLLAIVLAAGMWFGARGTGVRAVGLLALVLVSLQGILGILRVRYNVFVGPELAMIHGLFAQLVFAALVGVAVVTSSAWRREPTDSATPGLRRLGLVVLAAIYGQIVFGAIVRHLQSLWAQRAHLLFAFAVVILVQALMQRARRVREVPIATMILATLVFVQISFGVEAWMRRFGAGVPVEMLPWSAAADFVRSAHFFVGALLFATAVATNLMLYRPAYALAAQPLPRTERPASGLSPIAASIGGAL